MVHSVKKGLHLDKKIVNIWKNVSHWEIKIRTVKYGLQWNYWSHSKKMDHTVTSTSISNGSECEKWVTIRKMGHTIKWFTVLNMGHTIKWFTLLNMGYTVKNGSHCEKWVIFRKKNGSHCKNWSHSIIWVTLKNGLHCVRCVTFGKVGQIWKIGSLYKKWFAL